VPEAQAPAQDEITAAEVQPADPVAAVEVLPQKVLTEAAQPAQNVEATPEQQSVVVQEVAPAQDEVAAEVQEQQGDPVVQTEVQQGAAVPAEATHQQEETSATLEIQKQLLESPETTTRNKRLRERDVLAAHVLDHQSLERQLLTDVPSGSKTPPYLTMFLLYGGVAVAFLSLRWRAGAGHHHHLLPNNSNRGSSLSPYRQRKRFSLF